MTFLKKIRGFFERHFLEKFKKNSSKWIKSSENIKNHEKDVCEKKSYSLQIKKNLDLEKFQFFFYEMDKKFRKTLYNEKICL